MSSLILTVISIALLSVISVITVNYLPGWAKEQAAVAPVVINSSLVLERAFQLYAKAHSDTVATVATGDEDGGLSANFLPYLGFVPATIPNFRWVYGRTDSGAPAGYRNTNYFCLEPLTAVGASQGKVRGVQQAQLYLSAEQAFVSPTCGSPVNSAYTTFPAAFAHTFFVRYVPGQL